MPILNSLRNLIAESPLNLAGTAKALSNLTFPNRTGGGLGWSSFLPFIGGTRINYKQELDAGESFEGLRNLTLIQAAVNWVARGLVSAPLKVMEVAEDEKETVIPNHPLAERFAMPNQYYSRAVLLFGIALSWVIAGEAYLLKVRSRFAGRFGQPAQLWWEPHWTIRPRWTSGFIDYFEICRDGIWSAVDPSDVVVIRREIDPFTRRGFGQVNALLEEFYTDVRGARFAAQLFRHGLVPPLIVGLGTKENPFNGGPEDQKAFAEDLKRKMRGDKAGEPMVVPGGFAVEKLAFDYSKIGIAEVREVPENRFCAVMGISPHSLHLAASREASTYNNVDGYLRADYRNYIKPLHDLIAETFEQYLLPDYGETRNVAIRWDYGQVPEMQPDKKVEAEIAALLYEKDIWKRSEAREATGMEYDEEDEVYFSEAGISPDEKFMREQESRTPLEDDDIIPPQDDVKPNGRANA